MYFFRDSSGNEVDLLFKSGRQLTGVEIKSAATWSGNFKKGLRHFSEKNHPLEHSYVVYSGERREFSDGVQALPFDLMAEVFL